MQTKSTPHGFELPVLGLGTWRLGGGMSPDYSQDREAVENIRTAIDLGYTHLDTAEIYGGGHTEELIGRAIQGYDRGSIQITTKIWNKNLAYPDVLTAVDGCLRRLHTDYIDCLLIHWPSGEIPLESTLDAMNELEQDGKVHAIGLSNFNLEDTKRAAAHSSAPIATNQVPYNLYNRNYVHNGVLAYCQENGILLTAYSPLDRGTILSNPVVGEVAKECGATPAQVALNWVIRQGSVVSVPMSTKREHLEANLKALEIKLSEDQVRRLDEIELSEESLWPE